MAIYHSGGAAHIEASDEASRRAIELAPSLADAHTARAVSFLAQERYDQAATAFERAVELNPNSFEAWYQYARTAMHQGEMQQALELFEKASEVDPDDYQSPLLAAPIYRKLGNEQKAVEADRRGVALAERHLENYPDNARRLLPRRGLAAQHRRAQQGVRLGRKSRRHRSRRPQHAVQHCMLLTHRPARPTGPWRSCRAR
jgi:adenylate cyclase